MKNLKSVALTLMIAGEILHSNLCHFNMTHKCVPVEQEVFVKTNHLNNWNKFRVEHFEERFDYQSFHDGLSVQHREMIERITPKNKQERYIKLIDEIAIVTNNKTIKKRQQIYSCLYRMAWEEVPPLYAVLQRCR
jgi:hypothetical protein